MLAGERLTRRVVLAFAVVCQAGRVAAAVALGVDWMTPELEGKPLQEAVLGELRGLVADSLDASLEWVG